MIKISGRHKSVPKELKLSLNRFIPYDTKIVMNDICSCRHKHKTGDLVIVSEHDLCANIRGYYGSGIVNLFLKFTSKENKDIALNKLKK